MSTTEQKLELSQLELNGNVYDFKDAEARAGVESVSEGLKSVESGLHGMINGVNGTANQALSAANTAQKDLDSYKSSLSSEVSALKTQLGNVNYSATQANAAASAAGHKAEIAYLKEMSNSVSEGSVSIITSNQFKSVGTTIPSATTEKAGVMSSTDKVKLDGITMEVSGENLILTRTIL